MSCGQNLLYCVCDTWDDSEGFDGATVLGISTPVFEVCSVHSVWVVL